MYTRREVKMALPFKVLLFEENEVLGGPLFDNQSDLARHLKQMKGSPYAHFKFESLRSFVNHVLRDPHEKNARPMTHEFKSALFQLVEEKLFGHPNYLREFKNNLNESINELKGLSESKNGHFLLGTISEVGELIRKEIEVFMINFSPEYKSQKKGANDLNSALMDRLESADHSGIKTHFYFESEQMAKWCWEHIFYLQGGLKEGKVGGYINKLCNENLLGISFGIHLSMIIPSVVLNPKSNSPSVYTLLDHNEAIAVIRLPEHQWIPWSNHLFRNTVEPVKFSELEGSLK
jgi:hypothetical protein